MAMVEIRLAPADVLHQGETTLYARDDAHKDDTRSRSGFCI